VTAAKRSARLGGLVPLRVAGYPDTDWMDEARCRTTPDVDFFPTEGAGVARARRVCSRCAVRDECLEFALTEGITHGVWGGESDRERQRIRAARARAARGARTAAEEAG
jgi:WhiB family redox-sensing transcriptional regulator